MEVATSSGNVSGGGFFFNKYLKNSAISVLRINATVSGTHKLPKKHAFFCLCVAFLPKKI